jgi:hypothetical protein
MKREPAALPLKARPVKFQNSELGYLSTIDRAIVTAVPVAAADEQGEADADGNDWGRRHDNRRGLCNDNGAGCGNHVGRRGDHDRRRGNADPHAHATDANTYASTNYDLRVRRRVSQ